MNRSHLIYMTGILLLSLLFSCQDPVPEPTPTPEPEAVAFSAVLPSSATAPFKTEWAVGDVVELSCVDEGKLLSTSVKVKEVGADGVAKIEDEKKILPSDAGAYYAYIPGTGVSFSSTNAFNLSNLSTESANVPSASVARCTSSGGRMVFENLLSVLAFSTENSEVSYAILKGNNNEDLLIDSEISFDNLSLRAKANPSYTPVKQIRRSVKAGTTIYFPLYPGLVLEKGYTISAYSSKDELLFTCTLNDSFNTSSGGIYQAVDEDEPVIEPLVFKAVLPSAPSPFKQSWKEGDKIELAYFAQDGDMLSESLTASDISSDGKTATFVLDAATTQGVKDFYAMLPQSGVSGYVNKSWSTADISTGEPSIPSVTVAKSSAESKTLQFQHIFSLLSCKVEESSITKLELKANAGEALCKNLTVSFSSFAVNGMSSPTFESKNVMTLDVTSGQTAYFGLYPGLKMSKGYTITAYDSKGAVVGRSTYNGSLKVEKSLIYEAPTIDIINPANKTKGFDPSKIVASFAVVSDVHVNGSEPKEKWRKALSLSIDKGKQHKSSGLDAVLVAGDLIDSPNATQLNDFISVYETLADPQTLPLIYTVGNHDVNSYRWGSDVVSQAKYIRDKLGDRYFVTDIDTDAGITYEARHCVVANYHILSITPNATQPIAYHPSAISWLDNELAQLTKDYPERYVILLTHPMIANTVYGSRLGEESSGEWASTLPHYWATSALNSVLNKYPQVIVFGGHLHFPLNDPRSVWQGDYTVAGCGSVRYMAIEPGGYLHMSGATTMQDRNEFSQGNLLQFDQSGNFRLTRMDFYHNAEIGSPITSDYPTADKSHLKYKHSSLSLKNTAPVLSSVTCSLNEANVTAQWPAAQDDEFVHHYVISVKRAGTVVKTYKILADFYSHPQASQMKSMWSEALGEFEKGEYTLELSAFDSWDAQSNTVSCSFKVGGEISFWADNSASSRAVDGGQGECSNDVISYSNGTATWTANNSAKPRETEITLPNGNKLTLFQIGVENFKGNWTLLSTQFTNSSGSYVKNPSASTSLVFGEPLSDELLKSGQRQIKNNLGIRGMMANLVMDAYVDIDYEAAKVRLGLFMDGRKAQLITEGKWKDTYAAFLPELSQGEWGNYEFGRTEIGEPDYEWLWFDVSISGGNISAKYLPFTQRISAAHSYKRDYILGIEVMNFTSENADDASLVRSKTHKNTESGQYQADYITIYQANYTGSNAQGMQLIKK